MNITLKYKILTLIFALGLLISCNQFKQANATEFKSTQYLYDTCKEDLANDNFAKSFCAAYLEGYLGGGSASSFYILGQADNQEEIMERTRNSQCQNIDKGVSKEHRIRWFAKYFTEWIESNQGVVTELEKESGFMDKPAFGSLHLITTDERFCTQPLE